MRSMCALIDPRLMIEPPPASRIISATAWAAKKWCRRLTAIRSSHRARSISATLSRWSFAALLTSTRIGPSCSDVTDVTFGKERIGAIGSQRLLERLATVNVDVDERDASTLPSQLTDELDAKPGGAAANERRPTLQAGVRREHRVLYRINAHC